MISFVISFTFSRRRAQLAPLLPGSQNNRHRSFKAMCLCDYCKRWFCQNVERARKWGSSLNTISSNGAVSIYTITSCWFNDFNGFNQLCFFLPCSDLPELFAFCPTFYILKTYLFAMNCCSWPMPECLLGNHFWKINLSLFSCRVSYTHFSRKDKIRNVVIFATLKCSFF